MPTVRRARAFTLIEAMIVVIIVGVLAVIASVAYRRWVLASYMGEAQDMLMNIRSAEETFHAETGGYVPLVGSTSFGTLWPQATPTEAVVTDWGQPSTGGWTSLNFRPSAPVRFGYSIIAGSSTLVPPDIQVNGKSLNYPAMAGQPWFIAEAQCDIDNNSLTPPTTFYASSGTNQLAVANEGM